jgi:hypothetical protein
LKFNFLAFDFRIAAYDIHMKSQDVVAAFGPIFINPIPALLACRCGLHGICSYI